MKVVRSLSAETLRGFCVTHGYYTRGNNEAYEKLFKMVPKGNVTNNAIYNLAYDITIHSDTDGFNEKEFLENVMYHIAKKCDTLFTL